MRVIRIIPGAVGQANGKALILAKGLGTPHCQLIDKTNGSQRSMQVDKIAISADLQAQLGNLHLFLASATGLPPGRLFSLRGDHAGQTEEVAIQTLDGDSNELKVVVTSCYYDGYGGDDLYRNMLMSPFCKDAAFKLLVGDNLYLDVHSGSYSGGYEEAAALYLQHFWSSGYADVLEILPTFTTWDDHELWNNYPESQIWLARSRWPWRKEYIDASLECLKVFQALLNPGFGADVTTREDLSYEIKETPVVDFFVADIRSQRQLYQGDQTMRPTDMTIRPSRHDSV